MPEAFPSALPSSQERYVHVPCTLLTWAGVSSLEMYTHGGIEGLCSPFRLACADIEVDDKRLRFHSIVDVWAGVDIRSADLGL